MEPARDLHLPPSTPAAPTDSAEEAVKLTIGQILFSFTGRVPRQVYILGFVAVWLATFALNFLIILVSAVMEWRRVEDPPGMLLAWLSPSFFLFYWMVFALSVKRLHDRNRSGWFVLLLLIPLALPWGILELVVRRGTTGTNRFGADPTDLY